MGDILVLFGGRLENLPSRFSSWRQQSETLNWSPFLSLTTSVWVGFPFQTAAIIDMKVFVLGEFSGLKDDNSLDEFEKCIAHQPGSFLVFAFDEVTSQWHAWTDRFGTLHAYYATDGNRAALGTFSPAVAQSASKKILDWEALTAFFSFGFFPADRTHFTDMRILRPASHYVFDQKGRLLKQERYWNWTFTPNKNRSYDDTVDEFGSIFHEVMQDAVRDGRVAVPVSGGLDSRSTVAGINPEMNRGGRLWGYSYGYDSKSIETHIARDVAEARHLPFDAFIIQPYLFDEMGRVLAYTEGFQDVTQARQMFVRDEIAEHADVLIAALWGDVWLDEMGLANFPQATDEDVLQHTLKKIRKHDAWLLQHVNEVGSDSVLRNFVNDELRMLSDIDDPDFRVKAYKTEQWSFRWSIPPTRIFQSAAWPRKLFYDTRLTDFFATVPASFLSGRRLQIDYLKRFAPDLARITWQVYDANLYQYQYFNTWLLPKRAIKKAWRVMRNHKVLQRNWEVQFLHPKGRVGLDTWLTRRGLRLHEFVSPAQLNSLLNDLYTNPQPKLGYTVSILLTFSAWLEKYG